MKAAALILALCISTLSAGQEAAQSALAFLENVRIGKANLEPGGDTALTANTDDTKRREIVRRLERVAEDLKTGTLSAGPAKLDSDLAAVLVHRLEGYDPDRIRVFAVALVKRGERWLPAPALGSFANAGTGYAPDVRARVKALELWMLDQQAAELDTLRLQTNERMRREITRALPVEELRAMDAPAAGERFIAACAKRQLPVILALLGGLQSDLPDDWPARLNAAQQATATPAQIARPWRLLVADGILRTIANEENEDNHAKLSVACLDSTGFPNKPTQPEVEFVHLELSKNSEGLWQVDPPDGFFKANDKNEPPFRRQRPNRDPEDEEMLDDYPAALREDHPLQFTATMADAAKALDHALRAPTPDPIIGLLDLEGNAKTVRMGYSRAAGMWGELHDPAAIRQHLALGSFESGRFAALSFQFFSVASPDQLDLRVCYFEHKAKGWCLLAGLRPTESVQGDLLAVKTWAGGEERRWHSKWRDTLLAHSVQAPALNTPSAPEPDAARKLVEALLSAVREADIPATLDLTTWLSPEKSPVRLLRNLGYEINGARQAKTAAVVTGVTRGKFWTLVTARANAGDKPAEPVYAVVTTPSGPRVVLEADLFANPERSREFLNRNTFNHLNAIIPPEAVAEIKELFAQPVQP